MSSQVYAWGQQGQYTVAEIAYKQLTPQAKQKVDQLITYLNKTDGPTDFIKSAVLADQIKFQGIKLFNRWHYVHKPVFKTSENKQHFHHKIYPPNVISQSIALTKLLAEKKAQHITRPGVYEC